MNFSPASFETSVFSLESLPPTDFPEVAFAGRSNVGKSSLINCILDRKGLVKTSSHPGKTKSLNYFRIADAFFLVDLPGYGFAKVPQKVKLQWHALIEGYLAARTQLVCTVLLVDIRHEAKKNDLQLAGWLAGHALPFLVVYTKADKLSANERRRQVERLDAVFGAIAGHRLVFSAKTGEGKEDLKKFLAERLAVAP